MPEIVKKSTVNYFNQNTEKAVALYNKATALEEKNKIFVQHIQKPLEKLVENVIHKYRFYNTGITYNNLFDHILEYLIEKIHKIDTDKGKAYSYLTVTARNYGILLSNNNFKKTKIEFEATDCYELNDVSYSKHNLAIVQSDLSDFFEVYVEYIRDHLTDIFPNKQEIEIADALLDFFDNSHDIDLFNKKALYITIKEKTRCESRFITNTVNILKENFYLLYSLYQESGLKYIKYFNPVKQPYIKRRLKMK